MKCQTLLPACLLLLWMLTAPARCQGAGDKKDKMEVINKSDGIEIKCPPDYEIYSTVTNDGVPGAKVTYKDDNTGEYICKATNNGDDGAKIFVKFRSCDNCIELDVSSVTGIVVGNVVATAVIGVAVYLVASQARVASGAPDTSHKKGSDRQHLVPNEMNHRVPNDHYQPLNLKQQRDMYDVLHRK
uniref:T-cell surface glycoprotein CD3 gamma chain-like n=1 Tax=Scatophagus argus TaxID=75038 RepID=UPI001ED83F57|nr:T-cell surface glycoprotein CD3 gamma chain-like [Scatophagus argus]